MIHRPAKLGKMRGDKDEESTVLTEKSPLLPSASPFSSVRRQPEEEEAAEAEEGRTTVDTTPAGLGKATILVEIMGARHLPLQQPDDNDDGGGGGGTTRRRRRRRLSLLDNTYCVVQYGLQTIHRTKPAVADSSKTSAVTRFSRALWRFGSRREAKKHHAILCNPIWTVQEHALFTVDVTHRDVANQKALTVYLWSRPKHRYHYRQAALLGGSGSGSGSPPQHRQPETAAASNASPSASTVAAPAAAQLVGQIRVPITEILNHYLNEERWEVPLEGSLGNKVVSSEGRAATLALRFRVASKADAAFCRHWNHPHATTISTATTTGNRNTKSTTRTDSKDNIQNHQRTTTNTRGVQNSIKTNPERLLTEGDFVEKPDEYLRGALVTEREDEGDLRQETKLLASTVVDTLFPLRGGGTKPVVRIKPYPDPNVQTTGGGSSTQYMTKDELKSSTLMPSQKWIQVGSSEATLSSLGRLHLEILSAHNLPNVDLGSLVGGLTDSFCTIVYGDSIVQTDVISDELSPHWLPWTQRAFSFSMQHPAHMVYLAVFGYKRNPLLPHTPIGRVEINLSSFQNHTMYNLEYELMGRSHGATRASRGQLRLRLRLEVTNERQALLAVLQPPPAMFVNVTKKKSLSVARYTCCGEYEDEEKFQRRVFDAYLNEIERYLKGCIDVGKAAGESLIFWRNQVYIGRVGLPLYSLMAFLSGIALVENPAYCPSAFCFGVAAFLLFQQQQRTKSPSPWLRPFSFGHFVRILVQGKSNSKYKEIKANEGLEEMKLRQADMKRRNEEERRFEEMRESIEQELEELERQGKIQTKSSGIPLELLVVLGKVQSIVGGICRVLRFLDVTVTWELSSVSFWITAFFLVAGVVALFLPWAFLFRLVGWILVLGLLGPQNKLWDVAWNSEKENIKSDDQKVRQIFAAKFEEARIKHEEAQKMKAFRQLLFGRYSTVVPDIVWTPRVDVPLPRSTAKLVSKDTGITSPASFPIILGHQLCGKMIVRPEHAWRRNSQESVAGRSLVSAIQSAAEQNQDGSIAKPAQREPSVLLDQGLEVVDMFDEEAGFVRDVLRRHGTDQSLRELGMEIQEDEGSLQFTPAWESLGEMPVEDILSVSSEDSLASAESVKSLISVRPSLNVDNDSTGDEIGVQDGTQQSTELAKASYESSSSDRIRTQETFGDVVVQNRAEEFEIQPFHS